MIADAPTPVARSSRPDVRNPMLREAEVMEEWARLSPIERQALIRMLRSLSKSWRVKADKAWSSHKPPVAAYWKQSAVNARHLALAGQQVDPVSRACKEPSHAALR